MCSYYQSLDHDVNSCPYYYISDEFYARIYAMIEKMNERHMHFVGEMREYSILCETNPSLSFPSLEVSLNDNYESSLPLEADLMVHALLTGLEEAIGPPMIFSPFVISSSFSTLRDTVIGDLTLLVSFLPLPHEGVSLIRPILVCLRMISLIGRKIFV